MMNFLRIIVTMDPSYGGPCQGIRNSIPALAKLGVSTEVATLDNPDSDYLKLDNFTIHPLGPGITPFQYSSRLKSWLKDNFSRFDVVIIHGLWFYHSSGSFAAWRKFKRTNASFPKLYVMPHGMLDPYFQRAPDRRLKALRNNIFWTLFERDVINYADGVLFTCKQELELAKKTFNGYLPKRELNIGYGIQKIPEFQFSMSEAFRKSFSFELGGQYLLYLSRIHPKKGVDMLIGAFLRLKNEGHSMPNLVIAGPGIDTDYGRALTSKSDCQIHFPGMLQGEEKWGAFYGCGAFILPSHQENFGIAVVEALACGKPVLISDQVNIWSEITDGGGGIVGEDTLEGTYNLLKKWLDMDLDLKAKMGMAAKMIYKNHFTVEIAAEKMLELLSGKEV